MFNHYCHPTLAPYCYLNLTTVAPIRLRSINQPIMPIRIQSTTDQLIVPIRIQSTNRPIDEFYVQPLSPPDARTVLLPKSDNCRTYTPAIYQPTDSANTPTITTQPNDHANTPAIQRPINRSSSEYSTYYYYLMLAPHCYQN